jgi:lipoprotein-anchoring transpeptidase ErfK/SrfK
VRRIGVVLGACLFAGACSPATTTIAPPSSASPPVTVAPPATPPPQPLTLGGGTTVVRADGARFPIYRAPGPGAVLTTWLRARNDWAQPLSLPAVDGFVDDDGVAWYQVRLPVRPNGALGWVRGDEVQLRELHERIVVDLSEHRLQRVAAGDTVETFSIGTGAATTPTPPGRFFVWAHVATGEPHGPYGVYALGLSGFSDVITDWVGGGRLAIHGTDDPSDRGGDVSHGCVRVFNPQMQMLTDVPLGTPVWIHP